MSRREGQRVSSAGLRDARLAALPARAWRRRVPHRPAAVRELPRLGELHRATAVPAGREDAGGARVIACLIWPGAGPHQLVPACSCAGSPAKYATYNVVAGPSDKLRPSWPGGFLAAGCQWRPQGTFGALPNRRGSDCGSAAAIRGPDWPVMCALLPSPTIASAPEFGERALPQPALGALHVLHPRDGPGTDRWHCSWASRSGSCQTYW
jgi:hypothetical protein